MVLIKPRVRSKAMGGGDEGETQHSEFTLVHIDFGGLNSHIWAYVIQRDDRRKREKQKQGRRGWIRQMNKDQTRDNPKQTYNPALIHKRKKNIGIAV